MFKLRASIKGVYKTKTLYSLDSLMAWFYECTNDEDCLWCDGMRNEPPYDFICSYSKGGKKWVQEEND